MLGFQIGSRGPAFPISHHEYSNVPDSFLMHGLPIPVRAGFHEAAA